MALACSSLPASAAALIPSFCFIFGCLSRRCAEWRMLVRAAASTARVPVVLAVFFSFSWTY